jgi:predicted small metal-binding protein
MVSNLEAHIDWSGGEDLPLVKVSFAWHRTALACHPNVRGRPTPQDGGAVMYQFQCGHQECLSQYTASDKKALMQQVEDHLKEAHGVHKATETLMSYLEATCVTTR